MLWRVGLGFASLLFLFCFLGSVSYSQQATLVRLFIDPLLYEVALNSRGPYDPYFRSWSNDTLPLRPSGARSNAYFYVGFDGQVNVSAVNPGWSILFMSSNLTNPAPDAFQLIATESDFETPITTWHNQSLPDELTGKKLFGLGRAGIQRQFTYRFTRGPGLFFFKEVLAGPNITYGAINVSCAPYPDGTVPSYCEEPESSSSTPQYKINLSKFINWFTLIILWISIGGALMTILTFTVHYEIRTYPIKLIMYLCVCIVLGNFFFLMAFEQGFQKNDAVCFLTGMAIHGFFIGNFCWTLCIAFNFYQMIVKRNRESESLEKWYHLFSWGFPIFCIEWVAGFEKYGLQNGGVCYITNAYFNFAFFFLPGLIILAINAILFFFVAKEIHETLSSAPKTDKREKKKECRVYISICISIGLSWIFGFIMIIFTVYWINIIFLFLFTIFAGLQGFLIFLSYCVNMKVFAKWAGLLGKCIPFFRRWENVDTRRTTRTGSGSSGTKSQSRMASSTASGNSGDSEMSSAAD